MLLFVAWVSVSAAATYQVDGAAQLATVVTGSQKLSCYRVEPEAAFAIQGPASAALMLRVDLPRRPRRPRAVRVVLEVDGARKALRLALRRQRGGARYEPPSRLQPSAAAKPIPVKVGEGAHRVVLRLPGRRAGCIELRGVALAPPEATEEDLAARARADKLQALLARGRQMRAEGRDREAILAYDELVREDPQSQEAKTALAELEPKRRELIREDLARANEYFLRQDLASAAPYYERVLQLDPENSAAAEGLEMYRNLETLEHGRQGAGGANAPRPREQAKE